MRLVDVVAGVFRPSSWGTCSFCMRAAFRATLVACVLSIIAAASNVPKQFEIVAFGGAILLASIWVAHIVAYALREATRNLDGPIGSARPSETIELPATRRRALEVFGRTLVFTAILTALPSSNAHAEDDDPCSPGVCKDPKFPNCCHNPARGETFCFEAGHSKCCTSQTHTWACADDRDCNGTQPRGGCR